LFFVDKDGRAVSAHRLLPDKTKKRKVGDCSVFRDGYAAEINVPAVGCRESLAYFVFGTHKYLRDLASKHGYRLATTPMVPISLADLADAPEDVLTFGCEPSWDAYTGDVKIPPLDGRTHPYRYAGGHMHLGERELYAPLWLRKAEAVQTYVRWLDLFVGLPLTLWFDRPELYARRQYYGQAGEFRYQTYPNNYVGVEYRTPGPELWNHPAVASFAFGVMRYLYQNFATMPAWDHALDDDLRDAINNGGSCGPRLLRECPYWYSPDQILHLAKTRTFPFEFVDWSPYLPGPGGKGLPGRTYHAHKYGWRNLLADVEANNVLAAV
jgi:hypothetical protein